MAVVYGFAGYRWRARSPEFSPILARRGLPGRRHSRGGYRPRQDELLDRLGETLVLVGGRHVGGLPLYLLTCVAHRDAQTAPPEHQHIVRLVAERGDLPQRDLVVVRQALDHDTLIRR